MKLNELLKNSNENTFVSDLKSHRFIEQPDVERAKKALNPELHDINNHILRKDKQVRVDSDDEGESAQKVIDTNGESFNTRQEKVARIAVAIQRLIVKRAVSFCFGRKPEYNSTPENETQEMIHKAVKKVFSGIKEKSFNRKVARSVFGFKECAEYWYTVPCENAKYGFNSKYKLRCTIFSPANGDELYPYFDDMGDMVAFSRAFSRVNAKGESVSYFETFTDEEHWLWKNGANGYEVLEGFPKNVAIGKIPVVFGHQDYYETEDIDKLVDRLETLLSNFADTNDYHASPKIFTTGQINGWSKKGESGAVIEGEEGATMNYVSWQNAPESVKLEIETLLKFIYTITQTPDISFDAVKGLGAISGIALKLLFMDAHLKVQDKCEVFDEYLQRRVNVVLAYLAQMKTDWGRECESMDIEPEIIPYMLIDEKADLEYWLTANGNKPVVSQEESIEKAGISKNVEYTMNKIKEQSTFENSFSIGEPIIEE